MAIKQTINLYNFYTTSQESYFVGLRFFYMANIIFVIFLSSILIYKNIQYYFRSSELSILVSADQELQASLSKKELRVVQLSTSDKDKKYLQDQLLAVNQRERLLKFLKNNQEPVKFSVFLEELKKAHQPGMQISEIDIKNYGEFLDFKGITSSSDTVAHWLASLKSQSAYEKMQFEAISLERDKTHSHLKFEVKSLYE